MKTQVATITINIYYEPTNDQANPSAIESVLNKSIDDFIYNDAAVVTNGFSISDFNYDVTVEEQE